MFDWGPGELILILLLVLVVFGAGKLPEVANSLGKALRSFKDAVNQEPARANSQAPGEIENKAGDGNPRNSSLAEKKYDD